MFSDQRFWALYRLKLNSRERNDKEHLNLLLSQYPDFFSGTIMVEDLPGTEADDSTGRKEKAYEKHLKRLRNHLSEAFQKQ